jgi:hypothetical protein
MHIRSTTSLTKIVLGICIVLMLFAMITFRPRSPTTDIDDNTMNKGFIAVPGEDDGRPIIKHLHERFEDERIAVELEQAEKKKQQEQQQPVIEAPKKVMEQQLPVQPPPPPVNIDQQHPAVQQILNESLADKLKRIATKNNEVIITAATFGFKDFLYNWMCSVELADSELLNHILIYTVDIELVKELVLQRNFKNVYWDGQKIVNQQSLSYGSKDYRYLMMYRTEFIQSVLVQHNYKILLVDNDAIWKKNPLKYITQNYRDKDLVGQNDSMSSRENLRPMICAGFIYLNTTVSMKRLWTDLTKHHSRLVLSHKNEGMTEQIMLNNMKMRIKYALLPWPLFPSGYIYITDKDKSETFKNLHVYHNNWIIGKQKKLDRFKQQDFWLIDEQEKCLHTLL